MQQKKTYSLELGDKTLHAEFTDLADQASGSVIVRMGNTALLATAVMGSQEKDIPYFPLTVDYEERFYAAGAILGSRFMRREGRPSDEAVLSGRVVDRTIRPLFDHHIRNEVQVVITILALDEYDPDVLAVNAASLALATSDIPWNGPVSAVRIGKLKGKQEFETNPSYVYRGNDEFELDLTICGKDNNINMIEVGSEEMDEATIAEAFKTASSEIEKIQTWQKKIIADIGKEKRNMPKPALSEAISAHFEAEAGAKLDEAVFSGPGKSGINALKEAWLTSLIEAYPDEKKKDADDYFEERVDALLHDKAVDENKRADGRSMTEVRPLYAQAGNVSPILHGSGIFYRGGTHVFSALTLGGPGDSQIIDTMEDQEGKKRFMHHYNFPPYAPGETGRVGGFNRRQIGHGALAEKALLPVIPTDSEFPYTIRLVSECMASNGSTSMGSVCASTLALMDGGVPITRPVAGIAMGLMMRDEKQYKVLTDIQGPEDHHGDMDFKVAGTREGVTAIQMDVKVDGVPIAILAEALQDAKAARLHILDTIEQEIAQPRENISARAPEILTMQVKVDQIGLVIGPGGKMINGIKDDTGVEDITIEEDGQIFITGKNGSAGKAKAMIESLTHEFTAGEKYEGEVTRVTDFGAFVRITPHAEGLVHVSEVAPFRIRTVEGILAVGDAVPVMVKEVDEKGRINLSIKEIDSEFAKKKGATPDTQTNSDRDRRSNHKREQPRR